MLAITGLRKSYGEVVALGGVDLTVDRGEIVALLGPNGAGKTTLVSIVAGLRKADSGEVRVGNVDALAHPNAARRMIGLAPQDLGVYPIVSARENLILFGELAGLSKAELPTRIDETAEALGLTDLLDRQAGTLSGGERRRLHTAIALLHRPPLLLLDEATTGADVRTRGDILELVRRMAAEGSAILYSTHYLAEVDQLNTSVAILEQGRLVARGTVADLTAAHAHSAVELVFEGSAPVLDLPGATSEDGTIRVRTDRPAQTIADAIARLGANAARLTSVDVVKPNFESVYLALTGKRFEGDGEAAAEEAAVAS
ncbi:MAG: ABC transporter ATP-binding protein [Actinomycetota bacterium]